MSLIPWIISFLYGESFMEVILKGHGNLYLTRLMGRALEKIICVVSKNEAELDLSLIQRVPQAE
jgi:hypothetical protein